MSKELKVVIISASRRTDIPALFGDRFMEQVKQGECISTNPYNPKQVRKLPLNSKDVDAIVFWSKNPQPFLKHLPELDKRKFNYYFQFTLNNYPYELEPNIPDVKKRLKTFKELAGMIGKERVVWRYDPIILSNRTDISFHRENFEMLSKELAGYTERVMISLITWYRKSLRNMRLLEDAGYIFNSKPEPAEFKPLLEEMAKVALKSSISIYSCSMEQDLSSLGIDSGHCIDAELVNRLWDLNYPLKKDPGQRAECGCAVSRDIGTNNTCSHGCPYCYSTSSHAAIGMAK